MQRQDWSTYLSSTWMAKLILASMPSLESEKNRLIHKSKPKQSQGSELRAFMHIFYAALSKFPEYAREFSISSIFRVEKFGREPSRAKFFRTFHGSRIPEQIQPVKIRADPALTKQKSRELQLNFRNIPTYHNLTETTKTEQIRNIH
ncbi:unnamed protein product [Adineta ricciae]|uniref:Uncharacterized protein n=1 Tax=Adineta ricciae TaxID=249248 RepID=A0A815U100_ADIRI|nr:unnamed protein product [Adineta ricciae]